MLVPNEWILGSSLISPLNMIFLLNTGRIAGVIVRHTVFVIELIYIGDVIARRYYIGQLAHASQQANY